jgi:hypothetical protein
MHLERQGLLLRETQWRVRDQEARKISSSPPPPLLLPLRTDDKEKKAQKKSSQNAGVNANVTDGVVSPICALLMTVVTASTCEASR